MTSDDRKAFLIGGGYAVTLIASAAVFMYIALVGGNPYTAGPGQAYSADGKPEMAFHQGDWMYVRRHVCLSKDIFTNQSPSLYDLDRHASIALPEAAVLSKEGCSMRSTAVHIPNDLPVGDYEYRNVARFQNNLVGRDEAAGFPPVRIRVIP